MNLDQLIQNNTTPDRTQRGEKIKAYRKSIGLTLKQFAPAWGEFSGNRVSFQTLSKWENGVKPVPDKRWDEFNGLRKQNALRAEDGAEESAPEQELPGRATVTLSDLGL